jgi:hypothetical protein
MKIYGFADGHVETDAESNNDFEAFEKEHGAQPRD